MKRIFIFLILLGLVISWHSTALSHNPFTSKPETQHHTPKPLFKSQIFVKIILWQHKLKQKMSELIRVAKSEGHFRPLIILFGLAFAYGVIHAAGPGHGKVVAMSFFLSHRATLLSGILFGLCFALIHALSGAVVVLGLRYIIQRSVSETLASVTNVTQIVSFGLITLLGLGILLKHGYSMLFASKPNLETAPVNVNRKGVLPWALAVGLVPCPAVVMVMLFCLSMDVLILGLLLAVCISMGMATTISVVTTTIILGKTGILGAVSINHAARLERIFGLLSGGAIVVFGTLFLIATINTVFY
jgi:nickel/cobalt exporter